MKLLFVVICVLSSSGVINVYSEELHHQIINYYESSTVKQFRDTWKKYRKPIENAIELVLKDTYGKPGMNVYVRKQLNGNKLTSGFFVCDNIVNVLFRDMYLTQFPHLSTPEVSLAMSSNVLRVDADVSKIFIEAQYQLFRNHSNIVFTSEPMDSYKNSPFSLQQVPNEGNVSIVAEGCLLSGFVFATLDGQSVSLGHDTFRLTRCRFTLEISASGYGLPPIITPYFSKQQGLELGLLLMKPIRDELITKLQGAMFTYVNTSAIFGDLLPKIRHHQQSIFRKTHSFIVDVVNNINQRAITKNGGVAELKDEILTWIDKYDGELQENNITLTDISISGLDSAYSTQTGGPLRFPAARVQDAFRFAALQIKGDISINLRNMKLIKEAFYGEINDVSALMSIDVAMLKYKTRQSKVVKVLNKVEIIGWRAMFMGRHNPLIANIATHSLLPGILLNKLPQYLARYVSRVLSDAALEAVKGGKGKESMNAEIDKEEESSLNQKNNENDTQGVDEDKEDMDSTQDDIATLAQNDFEKYTEDYKNIVELDEGNNNKENNDGDPEQTFETIAKNEVSKEANIADDKEHDNTDDARGSEVSEEADVDDDKEHNNTDDARGTEVNQEADVADDKEHDNTDDARGIEVSKEADVDDDKEHNNTDDARGTELNQEADVADDEEHNNADDAHGTEVSKEADVDDDKEHDNTDDARGIGESKAFDNGNDKGHETDDLLSSDKEDDENNEDNDDQENSSVNDEKNSNLEGRRNNKEIQTTSTGQFQKRAYLFNNELRSE